MFLPKERAALTPTGFPRSTRVCELRILCIELATKRGSKIFLLGGLDLARRAAAFAAGLPPVKAPSTSKPPALSAKPLLETLKIVLI